MTAEQALKSFLNKALIRKKERYIGFILKPKTQGKFLNLIYHELENDLDESKKINQLNEKVLAKSGYKFMPPNIFGEQIMAIKEAYTSSDESFLIVSSDGKHAIYGPETYIDSRAFYNV